MWFSHIIARRREGNIHCKLRPTRLNSCHIYNQVAHHTSFCTCTTYCSLDPRSPQSTNRLTKEFITPLLFLLKRFSIQDKAVKDLPQQVTTPGCGWSRDAQTELELTRVLAARRAAWLRLERDKCNSQPPREVRRASADVWRVRTTPKDRFLEG